MNAIVSLLTAVVLVTPATAAFGAATTRSFSVRDAVAQAPTGGALALEGGGTFDPRTGFLQARGTVRCTQPVAHGPLAGCATGEGLRWEGAFVYRNASLAAAAGPAREAVTGDDTLVLQAEFFRRGDGVSPSYRAMMVVAAGDLDPLTDGVQNVWIEGLGFGSAAARFR